MVDFFASLPKEICHLIVGGGGMVNFSTLELWTRGARGLKVAWGIGNNIHGGSTPRWPSYLNQFDMLGIRDFDSPIGQWLPCCSCMHPAFEVRYPEIRDSIVYEHAEFPINYSEDIPKKSNYNTYLADVLKFLGSAPVVITNTYHGWYWSTLLGKKVVLISPWSTKFLGLKHPCPVIDRVSDWRSASKDAMSYSSALQECRDANIGFHQRVVEAIGKNIGN